MGRILAESPLFLWGFSLLAFSRITGIAFFLKSLFYFFRVLSLKKWLSMSPTCRRDLVNCSSPLWLWEALKTILPFSPLPSSSPKGISDHFLFFCQPKVWHNVVLFTVKQYLPSIRWVPCLLSVRAFMIFCLRQITSTKHRHHCKWKLERIWTSLLDCSKVYRSWKQASDQTSRDFNCFTSCFLSQPSYTSLKTKRWTRKIQHPDFLQWQTEQMALAIKLNWFLGQELSFPMNSHLLQQLLWSTPCCYYYWY